MAKRGNNEGSVYRRKDGRWAASISLERRRKTFYGKTRHEVARKLAAALKAKQDGLPMGNDRLTVGHFLDRWLRESALHKVRPRTFRRYREIVVLHLVPRLGSIPLGKLSPEHVDRMMAAQLTAGCSPKSVHHHRAVLRTALNVAMRWGLVGRNVASLSEPPPVPKRTVPALTVTQAKALLEAVQGDRLEALFTVALSLGLRQSEALGLRWSDVDLDGASIRIERILQRVNGSYQFFDPKTERSWRTIAVPAPVVAVLRRHYTYQLEERLRVGTAWEGERWGNLVFSDEIGRPLSGFHVTRRFRKLLKFAGLPSMRYHDLRHGAASLMAALGVPPRVAMEILGHSDISTTMEIYSHVAQEQQREAADRLAVSLWGAS